MWKLIPDVNLNPVNVSASNLNPIREKDDVILYHDYILIIPIRPNIVLFLDQRVEFPLSIGG